MFCTYFRDLSQINFESFKIKSNYNFQQQWCLENLKHIDTSLTDEKFNDCFELTEGDNPVHLLKEGKHYSNYLHPIQRNETMISNISKYLIVNKRWKSQLQKNPKDQIKYNDHVDYKKKIYIVKKLQYDSDDAQTRERPAITGVRPKKNGKGTTKKMFGISDCSVTVRYGMSIVEVCIAYIFDVYLL